ncbi:MAG: FAD/NAD(P)-binding protein [Acidobacteria bacterium]|nr:FAD/NAD(P)-binding protein [Acidobacteriota bacterium]
MSLALETPAAAERSVMEPVAARLASVAKETHDTFTLNLEPPEGDPVAVFQPGQFSMLYVPGVGELPISISGDPERREQLTYTIRSVGQVTYQLVTRRPGDTIGIRGPFGTAWPMKESRGKSVLIVAGGIGLAPLRPAIYHILRHRGDYNRLVVLYGGRSPRDLLYKKEFAAWGMLPDTQALATVDYGGVSWRGYVGVVTTLFRHVRMQPKETVAMLCGPEIMMRYASRELETRGIPPEQIHLSMERNMKCAVGFCGHCQMGPYFVCKDGPVFPYTSMKPYMDLYEL